MRERFKQRKTTRAKRMAPRSRADNDRVADKGNSSTQSKPRNDHTNKSSRINPRVTWTSNTHEKQAFPRAVSPRRGNSVDVLTSEEYANRNNALGTDTGRPASYAFLPPPPSLQHMSMSYGGKPSGKGGRGPTIIHTHITPAFGRRIDVSGGAGLGDHGLNNIGRTSSGGVPLSMRDANASTEDGFSNIFNTQNANSIDDEMMMGDGLRVWIKDFSVLLTDSADPASAGMHRGGGIHFSTVSTTAAAASTNGGNGTSSAFMAGPDTSSTGSRIVTLRMMVYPLSPLPFPQCHRMVLTSPLEDAFFHWTFLCTPFSFRSLVKNMRWDVVNQSTIDGMTNDSDAAMTHTFEQFGRIVRDRVRECAVSSAATSANGRFLARLHIDRREPVAILTFTEVVRGYRCLDLLTLDFVPSQWEDVMRDVRTDYARMKTYHEDLKGTLIQILDTVARYQPSLLLISDLGPETTPIYQPHGWTSTQSHFLPSTVNLKDRADGRLMTEHERQTRRKAFVLATMDDHNGGGGRTFIGQKGVDAESYNNDASIEAMHSKTVHVYVMDADVTNEKDAKLRRLTFTFYARMRRERSMRHMSNINMAKSAGGRGDGEEALAPALSTSQESMAVSTEAEAYFVVVTDPDDVFFHYTSEDVTPERFLELTQHLCVKVGAADGSGTHSGAGGASGGTMGLLRRQVRSRNPRRAREARLGFHPDDGVGGVLGVLSGDFLSGVESEPDRYSAIFRITNPKESNNADDGEENVPNTSHVNQNVHFDRTQNTADHSTHRRGQSPQKRTSPVRARRAWLNTAQPRQPTPAERAQTPHFSTDDPQGAGTDANTKPAKTTQPSRTRATLTVIERVLYRTTELADLAFIETPRDRIKAKIQDKYLYLKSEMDVSRDRLNAVLDAVRRKSYGLWVLLGKVKIPKDVFMDVDHGVVGGQEDTQGDGEDERDEWANALDYGDNGKSRAGGKKPTQQYAKSAHVRSNTARQHIQRLDFPSPEHSRGALRGGTGAYDPASSMHRTAAAETALASSSKAETIVRGDLFDASGTIPQRAVTSPSRIPVQTLPGWKK